MKRTGCSDESKLRVKCALLLVMAVAGGALLQSPAAQESLMQKPPASTASNERNPASPHNSTSAAGDAFGPTRGHSLSAGVEDILQMSRAGVSREVIRSYVENVPQAQYPTPDDLIALKTHGIPDDITAALLKRSVELRGQISRAKRAAIVGAAAKASSDRLDPYLLDPEGYEYFRYHYLYPRTLGSLYERLPSYAPSYPFGRPLNFGPNPWFGYSY